MNPSLSSDIVANTKLLSWLLERVKGKEHDENRGYAAELLSILLQDSTPNRLAFSKADGVEVLLSVLSVGP